MEAKTTDHREGLHEVEDVQKQGQSSWDGSGVAKGQWGKEVGREQG